MITPSGAIVLQIYEKYDKELCIVATNVSTATVEFFHPKTTPDVSVALAVRCSVSLPGKHCSGRQDKTSA